MVLRGWCKCSALTLALVSVANRAHGATCESFPDLCGLTVASLPGNSPDLSWAIDTVIVGDGFDLSSPSGLAEWHAQAQLLIDTLQGQTLASVVSGTTPNGVARASLFNFHVVDVSSASYDFADTDLFDTAFGTQLVSGYLSADMPRVNLAALNAPDVDVVVMIANTWSGTANSFLPTSLASGSSIRTSRNYVSISHEMVHALAGLHDEYALASCAPPPTEAQLVAKRNVTTEQTCAKLVATTPGYECDELDRGVSCCVEGAAHCTNGVYRATTSCQMRDSSTDGELCPVCRHALDAVLDARALGVDSAMPWAVITQPVADATVGGRVNLAAVFYDDFAVPLTVRFELDGVPVADATASLSPAQASFDSRLLGDGAYELVAVSLDEAGNESTSFAALCTIDNSCATEGDCDSDGDTCTTERCVENRCVSEPIDGCCHTAVDCDDGNACTAEACGVGETCVYQVLRNCCNDATECDDGNVCTSDACVAHGCAHEPMAGCCRAAADCDDTDTCTVDECVNAICQHTLIHACPAPPAPLGSRGEGCGCSAADDRSVDDLWILMVVLLWLPMRRLRPTTGCST